MRNVDVYEYGMEETITLGTEKVLVYRPEPPKASIHTTHLSIRVQGAITVPCAKFVYLESITLNSTPIEWLSINDEPETKFVRMREASHDFYVIHKYAPKPRIWPSVRIYPAMKGLTRVVLRYTGLVPDNGKEGEEVIVQVKFTGQRR